MTPAFLIIPMLRYLGARAGQPEVKSAIQCVMIAAAGLVVSTTVPLARDALTSPLASRNRGGQLFVSGPDPARHDLGGARLGGGRPAGQVALNFWEL